MANSAHGPIAKAFIVMNRIFGAGAVLGGAYILGIVALAVVRGRELSSMWQPCVTGLLLVVAGVAYLRAPLFREPKE